MENWENYRFILALHRSGTIRGAAKALRVNHATVSRRLSQINSGSTSAVFEKTSGGYTATDVGLEQVAAAEKIESITLSAERKSRAISANLSGSIRISMGEPIAQILLQDDLFEFGKEHPKIKISVETSVDMVNLDRSEADIVIRASNTPPEHLVGRRLFPFYLCDYGSREYLDNTRHEDREWIQYSKSAMAPDWIETSSHPNSAIAMYSDDLMFLLQAAKTGYGMIRTACYMADKDPDLVRLPDAKPIKAQDLWVLTHPDLRKTKRIQFAMKHLVTALENKRAYIEGDIF